MRIVAFLIIIFFVACKNEPPVVTDASTISGRWDVYDAYRNEKQTNTLSSGYFKFEVQDSSVESNIFQVSEPKTYKIADGNQLKINGTESYDLRIAKLQGDTMILKGKVWLYEMEFRLRKNDDPNATPPRTSEVE